MRDMEKIIIEVPEGFHKILRMAAGAEEQTIKEYVLDQLICGLDADLQDPDDDSTGLWPFTGFGCEKEYADKLRALAYPK